MDITEIKARREQLDETIRAELAQFEEDTGVSVSHVNAVAQRTGNEESTWPGQVRISLRIDDE